MLAPLHGEERHRLYAMEFIARIRGYRPSAAAQQVGTVVGRGPPNQGRNIQSFLATPTGIYTTVYIYIYVYRYTAYTIYRQHGAKFCQVLSSLPCIRARPYHCISWADSTPTRIYTTLLHYKIYTTLRIFPPCGWLAFDFAFLLILPRSTVLQLQVGSDSLVRQDA